MIKFQLAALWGILQATHLCSSDHCVLCVGQPPGPLPTETWRKIILTKSQCDFPARGDKAAGERVSVK